MAGLAATLWIPAFAGMTGAKCKRRRNDSPIELSVNPLLAHKGRMYPLDVIHARFRVIGLVRQKDEKPNLPLLAFDG